MKVLQAKTRLEQSQNEFIASRGRAECLKREKDCLQEFVSISRAEEAFYKQKARNQWLNLGDQNKTYFHRLIKVRNTQNTIKHLWDDNGRKV